MGADILSAGTDVIKIRGVKYLHGTTYSVIPDQIEAGTFMAIAAAARSNILIRNVIPKHLEPITQKLVKIGVQVEQFDDAVRVIGGPEYFGTSIKTNPHPGFPTDMQPQMAAVLTCAKGASMVTESIFDNRFRYVDELRRMGANISVEGRVAVIEGVERLKGAPVKLPTCAQARRLSLRLSELRELPKFTISTMWSVATRTWKSSSAALALISRKSTSLTPLLRKSCSERLSDGEDIPDLQLQQRECYVYRHEGAWYPDRRRVQLPGAEKLAGTHRHLNVPDRGAVHHARAY